MSDRQWEKFFELLDLVVNEETPYSTWKERAKAVLTRASDKDKTNLEEFWSWFTDSDAFRGELE